MKSLNFVLLIVLALATLTFAAEKKVEIKIDRMTCNGCVEKVKTSLEKVEGVKSAEVSLENKTAVVTFDDAKTNEKALKKAVNSAGFKAKEIKESSAAGCCPKPPAGCCAGAKR